MTAAAAVSGCLINMLNASLRFQRILDMRVVGLSADYCVAFVVQYRGGRVVSKGAVQTEIILGAA